MIWKVLYEIARLGFAMYMLFREIWRNIWSRMRQMRLDRESLDDASLIQQTKLKNPNMKTPFHLAIVLQPDQIQFQNDLSRFLLWAIECGVPRISLYDYNGICLLFMFV